MKALTVTLQTFHEIMAKQVTIRKYVRSFTSHHCTFAPKHTKPSKSTRAVRNEIKPLCRQFITPKAEYGGIHRRQIDQWLDQTMIDLNTAPTALAITQHSSGAYIRPSNEAEITHTWSHLCLDPLNHVMKVLYERECIPTCVEMRIQQSQPGGIDNKQSGQYQATTPDFTFVACEPGKRRVVMTTEIKPSTNNDVVTTFVPEMAEGRKTLSEAVVKQLYQYIDYEKYQLGYWSLGTEQFLVYGRFRKPAAPERPWEQRKNAHTDLQKEERNGVMEFHAVAW